MRIGYPSWSVDVSDEWTVTEDPECLTLELSDQGALQGSSASMEDGPVTEEDVLYFLEGEADGWGAHTSCRQGDFEGIVYAYEEDGVAWTRWYLWHGSTLVFFTYNAEPAVARMEKGAVNALLSTLRVEP